jgi:hypothetical protein
MTKSRLTQPSIKYKFYCLVLKIALLDIILNKLEWREDEEEDVRSYWMILKKREHIGN